MEMEVAPNSETELELAPWLARRTIYIQKYKHFKCMRQTVSPRDWGRTKSQHVVHPSPNKVPITQFYLSKRCSKENEEEPEDHRQRGLWF